MAMLFGTENSFVFAELKIWRAPGARFDGAPSETEIQEARGASRGNGVLGATDADPLSLRFGLRSMDFLTDFFADRRERATSKLAVRASKHGLFMLRGEKTYLQNVGWVLPEAV